MKFVGMGETEFKLDVRDNKFKIIEINPRSVMSMALPVYCNVDIPWLTYCAFADLEVPPVPSQKNGPYWIHGGGIGRVLFSNGKGNYKRYLANLLKGLFSSHCFAVASVSDPKPIWEDSVGRTLRKFRKKRQSDSVS